MKRKIIQLAKKTLVVSLPAKWVQKYNINKGDEVEIEDSGRVLKINTLSEKEDEKTTIKILSKDHFLRRVIYTPYGMGYNEIRIEYDDPAIYYSIQNEVNNLMGFEIIKQGDGYCIARNIAQGIETEFEPSINRLFLITIGFFEDILDAVSKKEYEKMEMIRNTEDINNRLAHFCKRMLNLEKHPNNIRSRSIYMIVCLLEETGDIAKKMCNYIIENKVMIRKENINYLKKVIEQIRMVFSLHKKFRQEDIPMYGALEKENEKHAFELMKSPNKDNYITFCISMVVENTKHISQEVFE